MIDNQAACLKAVTQDHESFFYLRVIGIVDQACALVQENRLRLVERDAVLGEVGSSLAPVPGKVYIAHSIILALPL